MQVDGELANPNVAEGQALLRFVFQQQPTLFVFSLLVAT